MIELGFHHPRKKEREKKSGPSKGEIGGTRKGVTLNDPAPEVDPSLLHDLFLFVPRLLAFDFIFQSEPRVSSFQMRIVLHSEIHKK